MDQYHLQEVQRQHAHHLSTSIALPNERDCIPKLGPNILDIDYIQTCELIRFCEFAFSHTLFSASFGLMILQSEMRHRAWLGGREAWPTLCLMSDCTLATNRIVTNYFRIAMPSMTIYAATKLTFLGVIILNRYFARFTHEITIKFKGSLI